MKNITVAELRERLTGGETIHLLDVREPHEHEQFNIGGTLLPLGKIKMMEIDSIEDWKADEVICYCRSGSRSMQAAMMLETFGFANVNNLAGGMLAWGEY